MIGKAIFGLTVSVAFVGYCIYYDMKRRSDPDYKRKLHERRLKKRIHKGSSMKDEGNQISDFQDIKKLEMFFTHEIELGEKYIAAGDFETGIAHIANALIVCDKPNRLIDWLQMSLPPAAYRHLLQALHQRSTLYHRVEEPTSESSTSSGVVENSSAILTNLD